jgi:hypothetical protein
LLTSKYHMSTIIAIFFALGIGILIGGTLGQKWVVQTEDRVVDLLMTRYENQLSLNQLLQKQIGSLQLMSQASAPILQNRKIMWIRPDDLQNELLSFVIRSAGAEWSEQSMAEGITAFDSDLDTSSAPDIILVSDSGLLNSIPHEMVPKVIQVSPQALRFNSPEEALDFILYLKKISEGETHEVLGIHHYPGLE